MARARTGSIDEVAGGFRVRMTMPNGDRKPLGTYPTWEEAEGVRLAAIEALDVEAGGDVAILGDFGTTWIDKRDREKTLRDVEGYRSNWENHVLTHTIAAMPLKGLRAKHLDELVTSLRSKDLASQTIKNVLTVVRGVVRSALRKGLMKIDPFAGGVPVPKDTRTREPWTYLTPDEQTRLLGACKGMVRHLVAFAMATGLRAGELVTLRLEDVHEDHIVVRYGGAPDLPTKSGKPRTVPLNAIAKEAFATWRAGLVDYTKSQHHPNGRNPIGLAFPAMRGGFRSEEHVVRWATWKKILERAGITRPFRWHDLRHTCASALVSGWWGRRWSLEEVQAVLGHASRVTTERYAHLATDALLTAAAETGNVYWPSVLATLQNTRNETSQNKAPPAEIESATNGLGNRCSIH